MKTGFCWIWITAAVLTSQAQNPFARYKVEHYDSKNGMPNDFVMNTYQTKDGFIWMNSYSGYIRFDGKQFVNFNSGNTAALKTDNSNSLFTESEDGSLWFPTTGGGLLRYWKGRFFPHLQEYPSLFLLGKTLNGELILTFSELNRAEEYIVFNPETKKHFKIRQEEYFKYHAQSVSLNLAASDRWHIQGGRVYRKESNGTWRGLGKTEGVFPQVFYSSVFTDHTERTWLTSTGGIFLWNGERFNPFPGMEKVVVAPANPSFSYMEEDAELGLWVSTGNGVAYLPNGSERFHLFPRQQLNIQTLHNINIDREQNIWLATDRGVFKLSKGKVTNYAESEGILNNRVSSICEAQTGEFLISGYQEAALYLLKLGGIQPYRPRRPLEFKNIINFIHSIRDRKGNIWLSHQTGVLKIAPDGERNYPMPGQARYGVEGFDGRMYFGIAYRGLAYLNDQGEPRLMDLPKVDFSQTFISSIHQLKDSSWLVTTFRSGAMIIDKEGNAKQLDLFNGTQGVTIFNAMEDTMGVLWFATGRGLVRWHQGRAQAIGSESGLKDPVLFGILPDHLGQWWFPTNNGIFYAKFSQIEAYLENKIKVIDWKNIDDGDGMKNRQCVGARHSIVAKDGKIWVPSIGGLVEVDPATLTGNLIPPLLSINSLQVDDSLIYPETEVVISPGDHRYTFDYSALSFVAPGKNQVRYRLIGRDQDWTEASGDYKAFYTNLAPGHYRFEVLASNNDGIWAREPAVFSFTLKSFFYQTSWFKWILILSGLGMVWLFVRWRTHAARLRQAWLENEVSQRTADLKHSLDQLQAAQKQLIQSEKMASLGELTAGIAHEIQNPMNFVNNFSEVNSELIEELHDELNKGNHDEAKSIANEIKENEEKIKYHGRRADAIVKNMLQHSRGGAGIKEPTDIHAMAEEYLRLSFHGMRSRDNSFTANYEMDFDHGIEKINLVQQEFGRVLLNLFNNAFYAVNEKAKQNIPGYVPSVIVSTRRINESPDGYRIEISVKDNGGGVPDTILDKIFQPFFTTKPAGKGTGLGLSLAYDVVKAHGGKMKAHSDTDGAEFLIHLY